VPERRDPAPHHGSKVLFEPGNRTRERSWVYPDDKAVAEDAIGSELA
jgi:hypothetical protein